MAQITKAELRQANDELREMNNDLNRSVNDLLVRLRNAKAEITIRDAEIDRMAEEYKKKVLAIAGETARMMQEMHTGHNEDLAILAREAVVAVERARTD